MLIAYLASVAVAQTVSAVEPQSVFLEDLTSQEVAAAVSHGTRRVLIFSGGTEGTGPHLALGKHGFRVRAYADQIAHALDHTLVAPILPFAPNSEGLQKLTGTISLTPETFSNVNEEVARSLAASGFRSIVFMSDHLNSQAVLAALAARLDSEMGATGTRFYFSSDGYAKARKQIEASIADTHMVSGGHGGLWDTAETWAVRPEAVRVKEIAAGNIADDGNGPLSAAGVSGDPRPANPRLGAQFGALRVKLAVEEIRRLERER